MEKSLPGYPEQDVQGRTIGSGLLSRDEIACPEQATIERRTIRHDLLKIGQVAAVVKRDLPQQQLGMILVDDRCSSTMCGRRAAPVTSIVMDRHAR
ncbi:hypothetical protein D8770_27465 [Methylobacterium sp. DB1607]|nr:hypothetical protein [Methylobacterium sp. DB1607]